MRIQSSLLPRGRALLAAATLFSVLALSSSFTWGDEVNSGELPRFKNVKSVVVQHFAKLPGLAANDLISKKDVAPIFAQLKKIGWDVADKKEILARVPSGDDFLVKQLRTSKGRRFMKSIAEYPDAYDRLDRLSRLSDGKKQIKDLVRGPDGHKLIEYMTTEPGGKHLGNMLSKNPGGRGFNKPTGKIYTAQQFLKELHKSYEREKEKRAKAANR